MRRVFNHYQKVGAIWLALVALGSAATLSQKAAKISEIAHEGQARHLTGAPYFVHCEDVALPEFSEHEKAVAYLHDVLQKTPLTKWDLSLLGMPKEVIQDVVTLTPIRGEKYFDMIERLAGNPVTRRVKISDNLDNMDRDRAPKDYIPSLTIEENWDYKYPLSLAFLLTIEKGEIVPTTSIVDFIRTPYCPEYLRNPADLRGLTSHPIPGYEEDLDERDMNI